MLRPCLRQSPRAARSLCPQCPRPLPAVHRLQQQQPCPDNNNPRAIRFFASSRPAWNADAASQTPDAEDRIPLRKQLKQDAKPSKARKRETKKKEEESRQQWELTVGIEIHAQLDTESKLFSREFFFFFFWHGHCGRMGRGTRLRLV